MTLAFYAEKQMFTNEILQFKTCGIKLQLQYKLMSSVSTHYMFNHVGIRGIRDSIYNKS